MNARCGGRRPAGAAARGRAVQQVSCVEGRGEDDDRQPRQPGRHVPDGRELRGACEAQQAHRRRLDGEKPASFAASPKTKPKATMDAAMPAVSSSRRRRAARRSGSVPGGVAQAAAAD